jgi:hypothetical protein
MGRIVMHRTGAAGNHGKIGIEGQPSGIVRRKIRRRRFLSRRGPAVSEAKAKPVNMPPACNFAVEMRAGIFPSLSTSHPANSSGSTLQRLPASAEEKGVSRWNGRKRCRRTRGRAGMLFAMCLANDCDKRSCAQPCRTRRRTFWISYLRLATARPSRSGRRRIADPASIRKAARANAPR